jgi:hypothetical protein
MKAVRAKGENKTDFVRLAGISTAHGSVVELGHQLVAGAAATISFLSKMKSYAQKY